MRTDRRVRVGPMPPADIDARYVATMSDTLYAFDADACGTSLWTLDLVSLVGATPVAISS